MNATPPITFECLNNESNRFSAYGIYVNLGVVNLTTGLGQYDAPIVDVDLTARRLGYLDIAADRFSTPESTVQILAHELCHFRVEEPGAAIANARANAWAARDQGAYESACNLTEGYARLNEVRVGNELVAATRAGHSRRPRSDRHQQQKFA